MQPAGRDTASRSRRGTPAQAHRVRRRRVPHWWALSVLLTALLVPLCAAAPANAGAPVNAPAPDETGKYYVVGPPVDGQREYLYSIALRTLGNGNRFREIIELNRGREQPDGATFTDGVELAPGWILVLPKDADGPGVRSGPLPAVRSPTPTPSAAAPSPTSASPSPSVPSPSPSDAAPPAPAGEQPTPAGGGGRAESAPFRLPSVGPDLVRIGAGVLAVVLAVVAILVLPRRVHRMRPVTLDDGPWPPDRHHTPTPAELAAAAATTAPPSPPAPEHPTPAPQRVAAPTSVPAVPAVGPPPAPAGPRAAQQPVVRDEEVSRPTLPADGDVPYVRTELDTDLGPIHVRLVGVTTGPATPAYAWLADHEPTPPAGVPLVLGRRGPWRLQIDLGRAPDVFTLVGGVDECRRLAAAYARQLHEAGVVVAAVGDALGADTPREIQRLTAWPTPDADGSTPSVVVTADVPADAGIRGGSRARVIPLVIGPVPYGRWSAQLGGGD